MDNSSQKWSMIMTLISVMIIVIAILSIYRFQIVKTTIEEDTSNRKAEEKSKKEEIDNQSLIAVVIAVLLAISLGIYYVFKEKLGIGQDKDDSFVAFIPVWVAIFIPFLAKKRFYQRRNINTEQKRFMFIALSMAILLGISLLLWFNFSNK